MSNKANTRVVVSCFFIFEIVALFSVSLVLAQSRGGAGPAPGEKRILEEFSRNLGKGLKIFSAVVWNPKTGSDDRFVVAVTKDNNDERPKLRIFEDTVKGYLERLVVLAGDRLKDLYLDDVNRDGTIDAVSFWDCGQLQCISIVGYDGNTGHPKELLYTTGREIKIKSELNGPKEVLTTRRTFQEKPGEKWKMTTDVYQWNGTEFAKSTKDQ